MLCQFTKLNFPTFPHSLKKKQVERLEWRSTELTKKEAGQTDEIFPSPRNKSFQNSNCNRRTCFFLSEFRASPIPGLRKFSNISALTKKEAGQTDEIFLSPRNNPQPTTLQHRHNATSMCGWLLHWIQVPDWRSTELTKKEAGRAVRIFLSPRLEKHETTLQHRHNATAMCG